MENLTRRQFLKIVGLAGITTLLFACSMTSGEPVMQEEDNTPDEKQSNIFKDLDIQAFWDNDEYAIENYVGAPVDDGQIHYVEKKLGYKLPNSYLNLMMYQNGGMPKKTCHRTSQPTSWAPDHIAITGIFGLDKSKPCSLCGEFGSQFWMDEWGYPPIGIYFADCPSGGHDMVCLDYRDCGPKGEPQVVHVDQEFDFKITFLAKSFEEFIRGLEYADV